MNNKPKTDVVVTLTNASNNALKLCHIVVKILKINRHELYAKEISKRVWGLHSKSEALSIFQEYVTVR